MALMCSVCAGGGGGGAGGLKLKRTRGTGTFPTTLLVLIHS